MLSAILTTLVFTSLAASQAICPIKPYDARPGYGLMCVRGDAVKIYETSSFKILRCTAALTMQPCDSNASGGLESTTAFYVLQTFQLIFESVLIGSVITMAEDCAT
jgi:hypothetical protein